MRYVKYLILVSMIVPMVPTLNSNLSRAEATEADIPPRNPLEDFTGGKCGPAELNALQTELDDLIKDQQRQIDEAGSIQQELDRIYEFTRVNSQRISDEDFATLRDASPGWV